MGRISCRIDDELSKDFEWALGFTGMGETQFVTAAMRALVNQVREHGEVRLPITLAAPASAKKGAPVQTDASPASDAGDRSSHFQHGLSEEPPAHTKGPRLTRARQAIREMQARESAEGVPPSIPPRKSRG